VAASATGGLQLAAKLVLAEGHAMVVAPSACVCVCVRAVALCQVTGSTFSHATHTHGARANAAAARKCDLLEHASRCTLGARARAHSRGVDAAAAFLLCRLQQILGPPSLPAHTHTGLMPAGAGHHHCCKQDGCV
jgi:hypothetical protein